MEFWGVEVKAGEPLKVQPEFGKLIHISQAALGEVKDVKGAKYVPLRLKVDSKNFIIGSLSAEDRTQLMFDLVFEKEFELSHDWKNGSIYFMGYVADDPVSDGEEFDEFDDESEEEPMEIQENGKIKPEAGDVKAAKSILAAAKAAVSKKEEQPDSDEDDDDDDEDDDESGSDDELPSGGLGEKSDDDSDEDDDDEEGSSSEEEELPKKSKKRPAESPQKTPVPSKKAKSATPDKSGNKKGGQTGKTPVSNSPKSAGQVTCKSCSKAFNSDKALESHSKAKHGGK